MRTIYPQTQTGFNMADFMQRKPAYNRMNPYFNPDTAAFASDETNPVGPGATHAATAQPVRRATAAPTMIQQPIDPNHVAYQNPVAAGANADRLSAQADLVAGLPAVTAHRPTAPRSSMMSMQTAKTIWDNLHQNGPGPDGTYDPIGAFHAKMADYGIDRAVSENYAKVFGGGAHDPETQFNYMNPAERFKSNGPIDPANVENGPLAPGNTMHGFTPASNWRGAPSPNRPSPDATAATVHGAEQPYTGSFNSREEMLNARRASVNDLNRRAGRINSNLAAPQMAEDYHVTVAKTAADAKKYAIDHPAGETALQKAQREKLEAETGQVGKPSPNEQEITNRNNANIKARAERGGVLSQAEILAGLQQHTDWASKPYEEQIKEAMRLHGLYGGRGSGATPDQATPPAKPGDALNSVGPLPGVAQPPTGTTPGVKQFSPIPQAPQGTAPGQIPPQAHQAALQHGLTPQRDGTYVDRSGVRHQIITQNGRVLAVPMA